MIAPAQPEMLSVGSCRLAAPGRADVGLYPIEAVADDGESTREREYRVSEGGREHDRCTRVMVLD